jgi:hypothetical protein
MTELLTVEVTEGTIRRLEMMGFPHDLGGSDVVRFFIEEGLGVLEKHRTKNLSTTLATTQELAPA